MSVSLGIDTGGTFTDFVLLDTETGQVRTTKVPSTPEDPALAIEAGLRALAGAERADHVIVGTTVATNSLIERRGPTVVYVTNSGFEDVPFIGRLDKERLYDLHWQRPSPLVLRRNCLGVDGRIDHHGTILEPLDDEALDRLREGLAARAEDGAQIVVAVNTLFAYLDGSHEQRIGAVVREALPAAAISLSHEVSPVWREYERASTTIADAFVKPVVDRYVERVGSILSQDGGGRWNLLASNGGYLLADEARRRPAQLLLSGLAGGVIGARHFAELGGHASAFSLDMGGTSCDIGLVLDGSQQYANEFDVAWGTPVTLPSVAVKTIGAGGGSIAWVDKGGLLHIGPRSAGADPGPVAYGRGGAEPTLTDANLVLGRLDPDYFLGGEMRLDAGAGEAAVGDLGRRLGLSGEAAALAAVQTADENMANAIRLIAVERGLDVREIALIAFGGAGPLHARAVAERLGIATVLVPPHPGLCSAYGAMITEARVDRVRTFFGRSDRIDVKELAAVESGVVEEAIADLRRSVDAPHPVLRRSADMRYSGQNYELEVPLSDGPLEEGGWSELLGRFASEHERHYGFVLSDEVVEIINLRVTAAVPRPAAVGYAHGDGAGGGPSVEREVWFDDGALDCAIYRRDTLALGTELTGPAIVEEIDSTTLVHPGDLLRVDAGGVLALTLGAAP